MMNNTITSKQVKTSERSADDGASRYAWDCESFKSRMDLRRHKVGVMLGNIADTAPANEQDASLTFAVENKYRA